MSSFELFEEEERHGIRDHARDDRASFKDLDEFVAADANAFGDGAPATILVRVTIEEHFPYRIHIDFGLHTLHMVAKL